VPNWNLPWALVEAVPEAECTLAIARVSAVHFESEPGLNPAVTRRRSSLGIAAGIIQVRRSVSD